MDDEPTYCIECWIVFGTDTSGKELTITAPRVSVFENQQASVRDVSQTPRPGKTQQIEWLEEGTAIDVKVFRDDEGQRFLDAKVQLTGSAGPASVPAQPTSLVQSLARTVSAWLSPPAPEAPVGIRLRTMAVRIVEPVKLGEKIAVPLNGDGPWPLRAILIFLSFNFSVHRKRTPAGLLRPLGLRADWRPRSGRQP